MKPKPHARIRKNRKRAGLRAGKATSEAKTAREDKEKKKLNSFACG